MNQDADNACSAKLQLKNFDIGKYNEFYKYSIGKWRGDKRYIICQEFTRDYEEKKMFLNEVKAWLNCREKNGPTI